MTVFATVTGVSTTVATAGKTVPLEPNALDKFIFGTNFGPFEAQLNGDFIGRRFASYLNDQVVPSTLVFGLEASYTLDGAMLDGVARRLKLSFNITNLGNERGISTAVVTGNSGGYQAYPLSPRMAFATVAATFERRQLRGLARS